MKRKLLDPYRNINIREIIGLDVRIVEHSDPLLVGLHGIVIDETRGMFLLRSGEKDRKVAKKGAVFEFRVAGEKGVMRITLRGDSLIFRPEDRTKKVEKKRIDETDMKLS